MEFVLKGIFDYAVSNGWIGENPVDRVTVPKIASDDDDMVFLSVREVELLADEAEKIGKPVDGLLVRWQAYTGCRIGCVLSSCYRPMWREFSFRKSGRF